jgi:hypothetical protein
VSATTTLELAFLAVALIGFVVALAVLAVEVRRPSRWDAAIAEHVEATGRYPTVGEWRACRVGWDATRAPEPEAGPWGPATVTVTSVDGQPVAEGAR